MEEKKKYKLITYHQEEQQGFDSKQAAEEVKERYEKLWKDKYFRIERTRI